MPGIAVGTSLTPRLSRGGGVATPSIQFSGSRYINETAAPGTSIPGAFSVINHPSGSSGWTFTKTADPDTRFTYSAPNLSTAGSWAYSPSVTQHLMTMTASKAGQTDIVQVFAFYPQAVLGNLALSSYSWTPGVPASGAITGAHDANEVISLGAGWPSGLSVNSAARTWAYDGSGTDTTGSGTLIGTHPQATNSPRSTGPLAWSISTTPANAYTDPSGNVYTDPAANIYVKG